MHVGSERALTIPAHMGYGKKGTDGIPPNSTLIFGEAYHKMHGLDYIVNLSFSVYRGQTFGDQVGVPRQENFSEQYLVSLYKYVLHFESFMCDMVTTR
jgi:hypothetical protein